MTAKATLILPFVSVCLLLGAAPGMAQSQPNFASSQPAPEAISALPALPGLMVMQEKVKPDTQFQSLELNWCAPVKEVRNVLLVVTPKARADVFMDEAWVQLATDQGWALAVVGVEPMPGMLPPAITSAVTSLDQRLMAWLEAKVRAADAAVEAETGEKPEREVPVRYLMYTTGAAAFWAESVMFLRPARYAAWMVANAPSFAEVPKVKDFLCAPGAVLSPSLKQHILHQDHFEDLRAVNVKNPVAFMGWDGVDLSSQTDAMARLFFDEVLNAPEEFHVWQNIHTLTPLPTDPAVKPNLQQFAWYPSPELLGAVHVLRAAAWPKPDPTLARRSARIPEFPSVELRWLRMVPKPQGVLVIAGNTLPLTARHSPDWLAFAKKNQWAILLMGLKEGTVRSEDLAAERLGKRFFSDIDAFAGPEAKGLPLYTYAQGTSAYWLQVLMLRHPERFKAWVATGSTKFPAVASSRKVPPGMVMPQNEREYRPALHHFEDLRTADPYNPVCLTPLATVRPSTLVLEMYVRDFLEAAPKAPKESFRWLHVHDLTPPSRSLVERPEPRHFSWFPNASVLGMWKALRLETVPTPLPVITKHVFKTKLPEIPELKLFVRLPGSLMKGQAPNGVICFCTWQKEDSSLVNRLKSPDDYLVNFADRRGLAMITWNTASLLPADVKVGNITPAVEAEMQKKFTAFGAEWRDCVRKVCSQLKLAPKDHLMYGISRGARFAHQLSIRYPEQFLAVHTHIGSGYNEILPKEGKDTLWLLTTGEVDGGYQDTFGFYERAKALEYPVLFKAGESLGHSSRRDIEDLATAFFGWALDLRDRCEAEQKKGSNKVHNTPASLYMQAMANAAWYGDYINHQAFNVTATELKDIPEVQRMPLPTDAIAKAWGMTLEEATSKRDKNFAAAGAAR